MSIDSSYELSGDDKGLFSISDIGVITFNSTPDFETPNDRQ